MHDDQLYPTSLFVDGFGGRRRHKERDLSEAATSADPLGAPPPPLAVSSMDKSQLQALFRTKAEARGAPASAKATPQLSPPQIPAPADADIVPEPKRQRVDGPQTLPAGFFDSGAAPEAQLHSKKPEAAAREDAKYAVVEAIRFSIR
jgi:hypothetical protein